MAGRLKFDQVVNRNAVIVNRGEITAAAGGLVALVAPGVENSGVIRAELGRVVLASGNAFTLDLFGDKLVTFAVDDKVAARLTDVDGRPLKAYVNQSGTIEADGGSILIAAVGGEERARQRHQHERRGARDELRAARGRNRPHRRRRRRRARCGHARRIRACGRRDRRQREGARRRGRARRGQSRRRVRATRAAASRSWAAACRAVATCRGRCARRSRPARALRPTRSRAATAARSSRGRTATTRFAGALSARGGAARRRRRLRRGVRQARALVRRRGRPRGAGREGWEAAARSRVPGRRCRDCDRRREHLALGRAART